MAQLSCTWSLYCFLACYSLQTVIFHLTIIRMLESISSLLHAIAKQGIQYRWSWLCMKMLLLPE